MTRCVLLFGIVALIATGCALEPRGAGDVTESDTGTPPGSSSEASAPDPGDDSEADADWDDGDDQDEADAHDAGPKGPGHGHH